MQMLPSQKAEAAKNKPTQKSAAILLPLIISIYLAKW